MAEPKQTQGRQRKPDWWKRESKDKKFLWTLLGIVVLLVVIIAAAVSACGGANQTASNTTGTTVAVVSTESSTTTTETATTTSEAATTTSAEATTTTAEAGLELSIVKVTSPVSPNASVALRAQTLPGADCSIDVEYSSGQSEAKGLEPKKADSQGNVSWTWKVGAQTGAGKYKIFVTVTLGGKSGQKDTTFVVSP